MRESIHQMKTAFTLLLCFILLTGLIYPMIITAFAQLFFPWQANGSLIEKDHRIIGSQLLGQSFTGNNYFWGRPSMTTPFPYNAESSVGSNFSNTNPQFLEMVQNRIAAFNSADPEHSIPVDLVTASGSGLDPDISPLAAFYQAPRIAKARRLTEADIKNVVIGMIQKRTLGILGEPRVNILQLNLALDARSNNGRTSPQS